MLSQYVDKHQLKNTKLQVSPIKIHQISTKIVQLQSSLQAHYCQKTLKQLIELYKIAIQVYSYKQPKKSAFFKKRLANLMHQENKSKEKVPILKPNHSTTSIGIKIQIKGPNQVETDISYSSVRSINLLKPPETLRKRQRSIHFNEQVNEMKKNAQKQIGTMVQKSNSMMALKKQLKLNDIQKQQTTLQLRLQNQRKKKQLKKVVVKRKQTIKS